MIETIRAWEYDTYGPRDVLKLRDVKPPPISSSQLLVRVRAAALNPKDGLIRRGKFRLVSGQRFPKRIGCDFTGEVIRVGSQVREFRVGDTVWGSLNEFRGRQGSLGDMLAVPAGICGIVPAELSPTDAAGIPLAAQTSLQALRDIAQIRPGDRVLLNGASGGVGVFAIQLAKYFGAHVITTSSDRNLAFCRELGADETLDYNIDDPFKAGSDYRIIFDIVGNKRFGTVKSALSSNGIYVTTVPGIGAAIDRVRTLVGYPRARLVIIRSRTADLDLLSTLVTQAKLRPIVDRVVSMEDVHLGFERLESRRARGKIVIRVS